MSTNPIDLTVPAAIPDDDRLTDAEREGLAEFAADQTEDAPDFDIPDTEEPAEPLAAEPAVPAETPVVPAETPKPVVEPEIDVTSHLADARKEMKTANDLLAELQDQFDNGDLGEAEHKTAAAAARAAAEEAAANFQSLNTLDTANRLTKEARDQQQAAQADQEWLDASTGFMAAQPALADPAHFDAFNRFVTHTTRADGPYAGMTFDQQLATAARQYVDTCNAQGIAPPAISLGLAPAPGQPEVPAPVDPAIAQREKTKAMMSQPPQTLRNIPPDQIDPNTSVVAQWATQIDNTSDPAELDALYARMPAHIADQVLQYNG